MKANRQSNFRMNKIHLPSPEKTEVALLSSERAQKLDLLIHLVTNLSESLVVCGPSGIGKTTLLNELKKCDKGILPILSMDASPHLSLEGFQEQLARLLLKQLNLKTEDKSISTILTELGRKNRKVVVIIDNAGQLVAGLMGTLVDYATNHHELRLIFSLNHDELHVVKEFDPRIEECHFVDIPPLTEEQCGLFLRELSNRSELDFPLDTINSQLIEKIYKKTHGIPGKVISEVSNGNHDNRWEHLKYYKWVGLAAIAAIAIIFFIFKGSSSKETKKISSSPVAVIKAEEFENIEIKPRLKVLEEKSNQSQGLNGENYFGTNSLAETTSTSTETIEEIDLSPKKVISQPKALVTSPVTKVKVKVRESGNEKVQRAANTQDDSDWVVKQPKDYKTIQLTVLSKKSAVDAFLKENSSLHDGLKFFKKGEKGSEQYVLIYGSFKDATTASLKVKSLPADYRKSWVRSFSGLQKIINQ
jgi:DamX protein